MYRRDFVQRLLFGSLSLPFLSNQIFPSPPELIRPPFLEEGSTVALIAPASAPSKDQLERAVANLGSFGYEVREGRYLREQNGFLAGTDAQRLHDLHWAFSDTEIEGIWCVRGGYGCTRLLPDIDFERIKKNPKVFIGYSDITALHIAIHQKTGLQTFHGPVAASEKTEFSSASICAKLWLDKPNDWTPEEKNHLVITPGKMQGPLTGGNLTVMTALTGTAWQPDFEGRIVVLEDIGEQPYRIDRMLTQLLQATNLRKAAGIVLGDFKNCNAPRGSSSQSLNEVFKDRLGNLGIPVQGIFPVGHIDDQMTWGYGEEVVIG